MDQFQPLCRNLPGGVEEIHGENCHGSPDIRCPGGDLNRAVPQALSLGRQCRVLLSAVVQSLSDELTSHRSLSSCCLSDVVPVIFSTSQFITIIAFTKLRTGTLLTSSCVTAVLPPAGQIIVKYYTGVRGMFLNSIEKFRIWLKSNQHNRQFTRRPMCIYYYYFY